MTMTTRIRLHTMIGAILLVPAVMAGAQDVRDGAVVTAADTIPAAEQTPAIQPAMSPAEDKGTDSPAATQSGDPGAVMTVAGVCPVVDGLVEQYCAANPDDISCQFQ